METIYCMNCGRQMNAGIRYCPSCGCPTLLGAGLLSDEDFDTKDIALLDEPPVNHEEKRVEQSQASAAATPTSQDENASGERVEQKPATGAKPLDRFRALPQSKRHAVLAAACAAVLFLVAIVVTAVNSDLFGSPAPTVVDAGGANAEGLGTAGVEVRDGFAAYSWTELSIIAREMTHRGSQEEALALASEYHLVDEQGNLTDQTKDITIAGVGQVPMRVAGILHDDLAEGEGKAGMSFLSANAVLSHQMKVNADNIGGWEGSQLRSWLSSEVLSSLDEELRSLIVTVDKHTNNVGKTVNTADVTSTLDLLWVPSVAEVCGPVAWTWDSDIDNSDTYNAILSSEGTQYLCFSQAGVNASSYSDSLIRAGAEGNVSWWYRTCSPSGEDGYRVVSADGNPTDWSTALDTRGVCLGFCL